MASICQAAVKIATQGSAYKLYCEGNKILIEDYISDTSGKSLKNAYRMCSKKCSDNFCKRHQENDMTFNQFLEEENFYLATDAETENDGYFAKVIKKSEIKAKKIKLSEDKSNDEPQQDLEQIKLQITEEIMNQVLKMKEEFDQKLKSLEEKLIINPSTGKEIPTIEEKIEKLKIQSNNFDTETEEEPESEIDKMSESESEAETEVESEAEPEVKSVNEVKSQPKVEEYQSSESEEEIEVEQISTIDGRTILVNQQNSDVIDETTSQVVGKLMKIDETKHFEAPIQKLGDGYIVADFFSYNDEEYIRDWLTNSVFQFVNERCKYLKDFTLKINKNNEYTLIKNKSKKKKKKSSN